MFLAYNEYTMDKYGEVVCETTNGWNYASIVILLAHNDPVWSHE